MSYSRDLLDAELISEEGLKLRVYLDNAKPPKRTIGIGRNLDANGIYPNEHAKLGLTVEHCITYGITRAEALFMAGNDIDRCEAALDHALPWWRTLSDVRQRVLLQMVFQMGIAGLLRFKLALKAMQQGAWIVAAREMRDSEWHRTQSPARAERLAKRMETGVA